MRQHFGSFVTAGLTSTLLIFMSFLARGGDAPGTPGERVVEKLKAATDGIFLDRQAIAVPVRRNVRINIGAVAQQLTPQLRPLMRAEYHFVRTVCAPTKEQRTAIALDAERTLHETATRFADLQQNAIGPQGAAARAEFDPHSMIQEGLSKAVAAHLTAEQSVHYRVEVEKRTAERRRVAILAVVAKLDQDLALTAEQRRRLTTSLSADWDNSWNSTVEMMFVHGDHYFPWLPDSCISPFLDETQRSFWRNGNGRRVRFAGSVAWRPIAGLVMDDDPDEDDELTAARTAIPAP